MLQEASHLSSLMIPFSELRHAVFQRYGEGGAAVIDMYNADFLARRQMKQEECFFGDYPALSELDRQFNGRFSAAWLMFHLHDLSEYCGCKEKLSGRVLKQCASVIATEFHYLKVSEVMLFFHWFKTGRYGRFYGSVDPLVITTSIRDFLKERATAYERHEREERERKREEERKDAVSWEEYCKMQEDALRAEGKNEEADTWKGRKHPMQAVYSNNKGLENPKDEAKDIVKIIKSFLNNPEANEEAKKVFCQSFKKKYGYTPQEYIEKHN